MRNFSVAELEKQAKEFFETTHWSDGKGNLDAEIDWHGNDAAAEDPELDEEDQSVTQDVVMHAPGHKDSKGKPAPVVIKGETSGKVIWSGKNNKQAGAAMARIEGHKAHDDCGMSVVRDIEQRENVSPKEGVTKYGSVKFADPINKKYPLDTEAHVRAAASYFGMAKNRALYSEEEQKTIQGRINAAEKKFKIGSK